MMAWPCIPLKHLVDINQRVLPETTPPETEFRYIDISTCGRGKLAAEPEPMRFVDAPSRARRLVRQGDTLVSTVRTYLRAVWFVTGPSDDLVVSTGFAVLSPRDRLDPRFLGWLAQSDPVIEEIVARSVGVSYPAINGLEVGELRLAVPDLGAQRAIADYLDAETARADALTARLGDLRSLLMERHEARRDSLLGVHDGGGAGARRLSSVLSSRITDGPHETPEFVDDGVPFLSVDNMVDDHLSFEGCRLISEAAHAVYARKSLPRRGDVLVTKAASVGRVAIVETDRVFNVWSPLAILRPDPQMVLPAYLRIALLGSVAQSAMILASTSNTQANLAMRDLATLRIAVPSLKRQSEVVQQVRRSEEVTRLATSTITRQIELLQERRQALITAAVTGQLKIPGVAA